MIKVSTFLGEGEYGIGAVPLFGPSDAVFEKTASQGLLPEVTRYISSLRPRKDAQYVLVNAMGAGEYYSSNINSDWFSEEALMHCPPGWTGNPLIDKALAKDWPYGFPTFYDARAFAHHKNKDPGRAYGEVELAVWNDHMKRVELVVRVDQLKCIQFGGTGVWDRLTAGQFPDVSMGTRVCYDLCLPAGTLVRTAEGHIPIEDVRMGDGVLSHKGTLREVKRVMRRMTNDLYQIKVSGLPDMQATANHPLLVVRRDQMLSCKGSVNGKKRRHTFKDGNGVCSFCGTTPAVDFVWVAVDDLKLGDYIAVPIATDALGDSSSARARLLGYYLGDGYIFKSRTKRDQTGPYKDRGVGFSVGSVEVEHRQRLLTTLAQVGTKNEPRIYDAGSGRRAYAVSIHDQSLAKYLQRFGGRTSRGKHLSESCYGWSLESKMELVAGYIDTDGSFDESSGQIRIGSVNRGLLLDVQRLLLTIGVTATVCFAGDSSGTDAWYLYISAAQGQRFLGRSVKVKPHATSWEAPQSFFYGQYWLTPVRAVEALDGEVEVFNLSVEGDESYVAEGRAVHNCSICTDWDVYNKALQTFDPKKFRHPGMAVLEVHKQLIKDTGKGIRGLSPSTKVYCFPSGTPVLLADGTYRPIEDIRRGYSVRTHTGSMHKVLSIGSRVVEEDLVLVEASGLGKVRATSEHPFLSVRLQSDVPGGRLAQLRWRPPGWVPASKLKPRDTVFLPIPEVVETCKPPRSLGWLLGVYLAEGCPLFSNKAVAWPRGVNFSLHEREQEVAECLLEWARILDPALTWRLTHDRDSAGISLWINSRPVGEWLLAHGGKGSHTKSIASCVWSYGIEFVRALLQGWILGDGSPGKTRSVNRGFSASYELAHQIQLLSAAAGIVCGLSFCTRETNKGHQEGWYVHYCGDAGPAILGGRAQAHFSKQSRLFLWNGYLCSTIRSVRRSPYVGTVHNLEVAHDNSYIVGGLAVHNCDDMKQRANKILPDGRKVFVYNPYPRMFDISFVFIGADRTAKVMIYIVRAGHTFTAPSAFVAEKMGLTDDNVEGSKTKTASTDDEVLESAFLKDAEKNKKGEIDKEVVPSQFASKAMPIMAGNEPDISDEMMQTLKAVPPHKALSTLTAMGVVLKPSEFKQLEGEGSEAPMSAEGFMPALASLLRPLMEMRSALGPFIERRVIILSGAPASDSRGASSHPPEELRKIGSAYNGYRSNVLSFVAHAQELLQNAVSSDEELHKLAHAPVEDVFTPLAFQYLKEAFLDFGDSDGAVVQTQGKVASVQRGLPSRNTWSAPATR